MMNVNKLATLVAITATMSFGTSTVAFAQRTTTSVGGNTDPVPQSGDPSRRVCRSFRPTGSRLTTRVCRTQAQWDELATATRERMEDTARNNAIRCQ